MFGTLPTDPLRYGSGVYPKVDRPFSLGIPPSLVDYSAPAPTPYYLLLSSLDQTNEFFTPHLDGDLVDSTRN